MKQPLVSIIIPVYNTGKEAVDLVSTLLAQPYTNLEIICVNDGSTDNSLTLLSSIKDARLQVLHKKNGGVSSARNYGIAHATGEYLSFIDSDDGIDPDFISELVTAISKPNTDLAISGMRQHRLRQRISLDIFINPLTPQRSYESRKAYAMRLLARDGRIYGVTNKLFRTKTIRQHKLAFEEGVNFAEDTNFTIDYLQHSTGSLQFILRPLYIYNYGTPSSTVATSSLPWSNWQYSFCHLRKWVGTWRTRTALETCRLWRVWLRWRISHAVTVAQSSLSLREQCRYVNPIILLPITLATHIRIALRRIRHRRTPHAVR